MEVKIPTVDTLADAAKEFLDKVITPPLEELGLFLSDNVKYWRFKRQVAILNKAEEYLKSRNIKTRKVSLKVLTPLIEHSSLEEDESLQEKWAALLVHTVCEGSELDTTLYSHILSQLTKSDAEVFEFIFGFCTTTHQGQGISVIVKEYKTIPISVIRGFHKDCDLIIDNLVRLRLIKELQTYSMDAEVVTISNLGFRFRNACRISQ